MVCEKCGTEINIGDWPFCPHGVGHSSAISDSIPGGLLIRHGLCNDDGTPRRYDSHTEIRREMKKRGIIHRVEHVTNPKSGSDKSKLTKRWI